MWQVKVVEIMKRTEYLRTVIQGRHDSSSGAGGKTLDVIRVFYEPGNALFGEAVALDIVGAALPALEAAVQKYKAAGNKIIQVRARTRLLWTHDSVTPTLPFLLPLVQGIKFDDFEQRKDMWQAKVIEIMKRVEYLQSVVKSRNGAPPKSIW